MKPPPFEYHDPKTVAEAVGLLGRLENAKVLAGGQSLMPMLNMRVRAAGSRHRSQPRSRGCPTSGRRAAR